jgi:hypothetical protein
MEIYLPIAEMPVNMLLILGMGAAVGFLSGLFGVGGGFLMTPLLMFAGIPPAVAVATAANQVVASSVSGAFAHWRRQAVDFQMGWLLVGGGVAGSVAGIYLFDLMKATGQIELMISLSYVVFLGSVGGLMLYESARAIRRRQAGTPPLGREHGHHFWIHGLPLKMRFRRSRLYISAIGPVLIGFSVGLLTAIMGVGGGFIMVPAMIYLLHMPTSIVVGTSLFQIVFVTALVTLLHAVSTKTVDVVLSLLLVIGAVIGAQLGARFGLRLRGEQLRALLGMLVLAVALRLAYDLVTPPPDLFSIVTREQ